MKKIILFLSLFLVYYIPVYSATFQVLKLGTCTGYTQCRFSLLDGNASIDGNGTIPISTWIGEEIEICDSGGKCIKGHLKSSGGGEALGSEINSGTLTAKTLYKITATEADHFGTGLVVGSYFTSAGTETCDANNKVKKVTSPSTSGANITTLSANTTYNWSYQAATFAPNSTNAFKYKIISSVPPSRLIASGSLTAANVMMATNAGGAMIQISGTDLSPYAGNDTPTISILNPHGTDNSTTIKVHKYEICLYDGTYSTCGFIGSVGTGEAIGSDILSTIDNTFAAPYDTFTNSGDDITSAITSATGTARSNTFALTNHTLFKYVSDYTSNSGQDPSVTMRRGTYIEQYIYDLDTIPSGSATKYFTLETSLSQRLYFENTSATDFVCSQSLKQVTEVATTGVHLHSSYTATDRTIAREDSLANHNNLTFYRIYRTY